MLWSILKMSSVHSITYFIQYNCSLLIHTENACIYNVYWPLALWMFLAAKQRYIKIKLYILNMNSYKDLLYTPWQNRNVSICR
jgi:hypothetical protein